MRLGFICGTLLSTVALFSCTSNERQEPMGPKTRAETSSWTATSHHDDVLSFIGELAPLSSEMSVQSMGKSSKGKDIPVIVLSGQKTFDPAAAKASGQPIVMVLANIHAGEVEGKEVALMLARDMVLGAIDPYHRAMTIVIVPDYNPDGNDEISPENRKLHLKELWGQMGPETGVGQRASGEGIDLNRDYILLRGHESRLLNDLYRAWEPDVFVDCHTTNGSILAYELTFDSPHNPESGPKGPILYARDTMLPEISKRLEARTGRRTFFYGNFRDNDDPTKGYETYPALPRYGAHFRGLCGTIDILLEAYSYADFKTRADVMYEILREIFTWTRERSDEVKKIVADARDDTIRRGKIAAPDDRVGVSYVKLVRKKNGDIGFDFPVYPLFDFKVASYDLESILAHKAPGKEVVFWPTTYYARYIPTVTVRRPLAYLVPSAEADVIEHLEKHKIRIERVKDPVRMKRCERSFVLGKHDTPTQIGGFTRKDTVLFTRTEEMSFDAAPGDVIVPMDQPLANLAIYLLEAESDDGLARWGFFGDVDPNEYYPVVRILPEGGVGGAQ